MKKLITLSNFATGTVKNTVTGEVKTVDTNLSEKERIKLMAKNIAEQHNAAMKKLEKEEEKEWIINIISSPNPPPLTQVVIKGKYRRAETVKFFVNRSEVKAIGSFKIACEIALDYIKGNIKDIELQKSYDIEIAWVIEEADSDIIYKFIEKNIEGSCCKSCKWFRKHGKDSFMCCNPKWGIDTYNGEIHNPFIPAKVKCDFQEERDYYILSSKY